MKAIKFLHQCLSPSRLDQYNIAELVEELRQEKLAHATTQATLVREQNEHAKKSEAFDNSERDRIAAEANLITAREALRNGIFEINRHLILVHGKMRRLTARIEEINADIHRNIRLAIL